MKSLTRRILRNVATTTIPYTTTGPTIQQMLGGGSGGNMVTYMSAMGSNGTLFSIVNKLSTGVAKAEWDLYRNRDGRGSLAHGEQRRPVPINAHPATVVLNNPNRFMSRQELFEVTEQHIDLTGEGYWFIQKTPFGDPMCIWPVRPDRVTPIPHPTEFLSGYIYQSPDGTDIPLELDEVIQFRMPNPLDIYRGMGPVQTVLMDLDAARYGAQFNRNFFINGAEPGGVIEFPTGVNLSDDDFKRFQLRWQEAHKGVNNAHRIAMLEDGAQYKAVQFSMRDMQFSELRNVSRDLILGAFGMSKAMLGVTDDVNRANAEAQEYIFGRHQIEPRLDRFKGALNNEFLPLFGDSGKGVEFDHQDVTPEDEAQANANLTSKSSAAAVLVNAGWDPDAVLETVGLAPMAYVRKPAPTPDPVPAQVGSGQDADDTDPGGV